MALNSRAGLNTPPGLTGPLLDAAQQTAGGVWVPSSLLRALSPSGDIDDLLSDGAGRLQTARPPDLKTSGTINAAGGAVTLPVTDDYASFSIVQSAVGGTASYAYEFSVDGGATWYAMTARNPGSTGSAIITGQTNPNGSSVVGNIPAGVTHLRVRASSWTSGAATWTISASAIPSDPAVGITGTITSALTASGNVLGYVKSPAAWFDDTATALAANASFTGVSRDLTAVATATAMTSTGVTGQFEVRLGAVSDQSGILALEVSRDNVNWRRIREVTTVSTTSAGLHVAEYTYRPWTRYMRVSYTNGGTAQTHFMLQTFMLAG